MTRFTEGTSCALIDRQAAVFSAVNLSWHPHNICPIGQPDSLAMDQAYNFITDVLMGTDGLSVSRTAISIAVCIYKIQAVAMRSPTQKYRTERCTNFLWNNFATIFPLPRAVMWAFSHPLHACLQPKASIQRAVRTTTNRPDSTLAKSRFASIFGPAKAVGPIIWTLISPTKSWNALSPAYLAPKEIFLSWEVSSLPRRSRLIQVLEESEWTSPNFLRPSRDFIKMGLDLGSLKLKQPQPTPISKPLYNRLA